MTTDRAREKVLRDNISYLKNTHKLNPPRTVRASGGVSVAAHVHTDAAARRRLGGGIDQVAQLQLQLPSASSKIWISTSSFLRAAMWLKSEAE